MDWLPSVPIVRLTGFTPEPRLLGLLPADSARSLGILPLYIQNGKLIAAAVDPADSLAVRKAAGIARMPVEVVSATLPDLRAAFARAYPVQAEPVNQPEPAEILYRLGYLTSATVQQAVQLDPESKKPAMQVWLESGLITPEGQAEAYGWLANLPHLRPGSVRPNPGIGILITEETARSLQVMPLWWIKDALVVAVPCCENRAPVREVPELEGIPLLTGVVTRQAWEKLFRQVYLTGRAADGYLEQTLNNLLVRKVISQSGLAAARALSSNTGSPLEDILVEKRLVSSHDLLAARSKVMQIPASALPGPAESARLAGILPADLAFLLQAAPVSLENDVLTLGMVNPRQEAVRLVAAVTGYTVIPAMISPETWQEYASNQVSPDGSGALRVNPTLGEVLLAMGLITREQLASALFARLYPGEEDAALLLRQGLIDEIDLCEALSIQTGIPLTSLSHTFFDHNLIRKIPFGLYANHQVMPVAQRGSDIWIAAADPLDNSGFIAVEEATGLRVWPLIAPRSIINAALKHTFDEGLRSVPEQVRTIMQYFVRHQFINQVQASKALEAFASQDIGLDEAIVGASSLTEDETAGIMAQFLGLVKVDLDLREEKIEVFDALGQRQERTVTRDPVNIDAARLVDLETASHLCALPVKRAGNEVGVAFASLPFEASVRILEKALSMKVIPLLAGRSALEHAIQRTLGRQNLGTRLLVSGLINRSQLNQALDLAKRTGVRLGKALVNRGFISEQQLYRFLAEQSGLPYSHLDPAAIDPETATLIDSGTERRLGILPISATDSHINLAVIDPLNDEGIQAAAAITGRQVSPVLVSEADLERALEYIYRDQYLNHSILELLERAPQDSAYSVLSRGQLVALIVALVVSIVWLWFGHRSYLIFVNLLSTIFYLSFSAYKFYLIYKAMNTDLEVPVTAEDVAALDDRDLPVYTLLVPVYREADVLPDLIQALSNLDYPATKLDIKVLFEADDEQTINAFKAINPPVQFQAVTVPSALPRTKPKACNYGLIHARGEYVVIFDAEDLPDRDQLKRVLVAFARVPEDVVCIQTKLNYYNRSQNLLTRWFTVEYSMWFDLFLPGLDASRAPIPLGGTSNHFKKSALVEAGAWDPFNVTEDADLGVRIFKRGYRTAIVDSTTYEEANSQLYNWLRQRSRWIKGYMQTWLVHMRNPLRLWNEIGPKGFLSFQWVVGGTFFAALMNPIYWALTTVWFIGRWHFVEMLYPGIIFFIGSICLYLGNFAFTYMNVAGAMRRGYYDMVKYALLSPLYWGLMSIAAWRGFFQLITKPHYWEKTIHGLTQEEPASQPGIEPIAQA